MEFELNHKEESKKNWIIPLGILGITLLTICGGTAALAYRSKENQYSLPGDEPDPKNKSLRFDGNEQDITELLGFNPIDPIHIYSKDPGSRYFTTQINGVEVTKNSISGLDKYQFDFSSGSSYYSFESDGTNDLIASDGVAAIKSPLIGNHYLFENTTSIEISDSQFSTSIHIKGGENNILWMDLDHNGTFEHLKIEEAESENAFCAVGPSYQFNPNSNVYEFENYEDCLLDVMP